MNTRQMSTRILKKGRKMCRSLPIEVLLVGFAANAAGGEWILLPTRMGEPKVPFTLEVDDKVLRHGVIEYAPTDPQLHFGVEAPVSTGGRPVLRIDGREIEASRAVERPGPGIAEQEALRPVVHFTANRGWLNDPNGLIWHKGEWHLFYQHNPYGLQWGNMHWGHAVSRDLLHWQELPIAIRPIYSPGMKDWAFSGSAVFDEKNTLGLETGPALVAVYTSTGRGECLAYSHDDGRSWTDVPGNPVLVHGGSNTGTPGTDGFWHDSRDPRVFRYARGGRSHWVMVVYEQNEKDKKTPEGVTFAIYISDNLRQWSRTQVLPGWYECPELFPLPVEGEAGHSKWILMEATGAYAIGEFDGHRFTADARSGTSEPFELPSRPYILSPEKYAGPRGAFYAGQTWNDAPDGRRILVGWVRGKPAPHAVFSQMMSVPVELALRRTDDGLRLHFAPVRELERAAGQHLAKGFNGDGTALAESLSGLTVPAYRMTGRMRFGESPDAGLSVRGLRFQRDRVDGRAVAGADQDSMRLDLIVDRGGVDWFVNNGRGYGVHASRADAGAPLFEALDVHLEDFSIVELTR